MAKKLEVLVPFFVMEKGDILTFSKEENAYVSKYNSEKRSDLNPNTWSSYSSTFQMSVESAKEMIKDGFLKEIKEEQNNNFVNVFDEIDKLIDMYTKELSTISEDMKDAPKCLEVEKNTVLTNLVTVLTHLKSLKK